MNDPIKQRFDEHKQEHEKFEKTINENLTIIVGLSHKIDENVQHIREELSERQNRLDDRVTAAHQELGEHLLLIRDQGKKLDAIVETQNQILALLQKNDTNGL